MFTTGLYLATHRTTRGTQTIKTLAQQIATAESKLALLRSKKKATDTRVKIIVGAVVVKAALESPDAAAKLKGLLRDRVTRELDVKDIQQLLASLDKKAPRNG